MLKIQREKDEWGQDVIYVESCSKYKFEDPETPKVKLCIPDLYGNEIYDIIEKEENYRYDSGK